MIKVEIDFKSEKRGGSKLARGEEFLVTRLEARDNCWLRLRSATGTGP